VVCNDMLYCCAVHKCLLLCLSVTDYCFMFWRYCASLLSNSTGESVQKLVFLVFFKSAAIEAKIKKIADAFGAKRYPVPGMLCCTLLLTTTNIDDKLHRSRL
jgi:V-type ATPase 116kDa subunit family